MSIERNPEQTVVVTGMGCVSPLGLDVETSWQRIINGEDAIADVSDILEPYPQLNTKVAAPIYDFDFLGEGSPFAEKLKPKDLRRLHRSAQFAVWAAREALLQAHLIQPDDGSLFALDTAAVEPERLGVQIGTGIGGTELLADARITMREGKKLSPFAILQILPERVASTVSMFANARGPVSEKTGACATGNMNIIDAARLLRAGEADVVIAGGSEAQATAESIALFEAVTALDGSTDPAEASRPFHEEARGFVIGEGAGILILETEAHARRRGAAVLAVLSGYGETADAFHDTSPSGEGAIRALKLALQGLNFNADSGIYVNAHATGTGGDGIELNALGTVLDPELVKGVSSTKGAVGHLLGAAGAFESVISVKTLQEGIIPPSLKLDHPIPEAKAWEMSIGEATKAELDYAINNSFGFGGLNAVTVYGKE